MAMIDPQLIADAARWRRNLHSLPEVNFDVARTLAFVAGKLREFGCDSVEEGVGVVAVIRGRLGAGPAVGFRAELDALPIEEATNLPYRSTIPGRMHACGHDGHMAMLLGAACELARTRNFAGSVVFVFQPDEEGGQGAEAMLEAGLLQRHPLTSIYALHNLPGMPVGHFSIRRGPVMAATTDFAIHLTGQGGHAAQPHQTRDPIVAAGQLIGALQTIAARNIDPVDSAVLSITRIKAGDATNIIPQEIELAGTLRTLTSNARQTALDRMEAICRAIGLGFDVEVALTISGHWPATVNTDAEAVIAAEVATRVAGAAAVDRTPPPMMVGEDFSVLLQALPGAFVFMGNGPSAALHNSAFDFDDTAIPHGIRFWTELAEHLLPADPETSR